MLRVEQARARTQQRRLGVGGARKQAGRGEQRNVEPLAKDRRSDGAAPRLDQRPQLRRLAGELRSVWGEGGVLK